jgi:hypothetical protein
LHATAIPLASAIKVVALRSVWKRQSNEQSDLESGQRSFAPPPSARLIRRSRSRCCRWQTGMRRWLHETSNRSRYLSIMGTVRGNAARTTVPTCNAYQRHSKTSYAAHAPAGSLSKVYICLIAAFRGADGASPYSMPEISTCWRAPLVGRCAHGIAEGACRGVKPSFFHAPRHEPLRRVRHAP